MAWDLLVQRTESLRLLPADAVEALGNELEFRALAPRTVLFFENELASTAYVVIRGVVTLTYLDSRQRRSLFAILGPGDVIGANPGKPESLRQRLRCDAFSDCLVGAIDRRRLIELLFGVPYERFAAARGFAFGALAERLAQAMVLRTLPLRERLLALIAEFAARFGVQNQRGIIVNLPLTHADLADLVGASRPKVSHQIGLLQKEGLLLHERHRIVLNDKSVTF